MDPVKIVWVALAAAFVVLEASTVSLTGIWFAIGALAALLAAYLRAELWLQVVVFAMVSLITLLLTRPFAKKFLEPKLTATNADSVLKKTAVVTETIDNVAGTGSVKAGTRIWTARSESGELIPRGETVRPVRIEGVKLIVERTVVSETADAQ